MRIYCIALRYLLINDALFLYNILALKNKKHSLFIPIHMLLKVKKLTEKKHRNVKPICFTYLFMRILLYFVS